MTEPGSLSADQSDLLDALEQVALIPDGLTDAEIQPTVDRALDVLQWRVQHAWSRDELLDLDLINYEKNLRAAGFELAADGAARLLARLAAEIAIRSQSN